MERRRTTVRHRCVRGVGEGAEGEHKFIAYHKPEDDPHIESFHGRFKREYVWTRDFQSYQEAEQAIAEAFVDYNQNRPHSSLNYMSPYEFLSRMVGVMRK